MGLKLVGVAFLAKQQLPRRQLGLGGQHRGKAPSS